MRYLIHSLEYLKTNCYEDTAGDFWKSEKAQVKWSKLSSEDAIARPQDWIYSYEVGRVVPVVPDRDIMWAVDKKITKEKYPEYYL